MDRVPDHRVDDAAPVRDRKPIGVDDGAKLAGADLQGWQAFPLCDVAEQLRVEPVGLGKFDHGIDRAGGLSVDQRHGKPVSGHDIPGRDVAMPDSPVAPTNDSYIHNFSVRHDFLRVPVT